MSWQLQFIGLRSASSQRNKKELLFSQRSKKELLFHHALPSPLTNNLEVANDLFLAPTTQHNTKQHNTTQHNTTQHNTTQHKTKQNKTKQNKTKQNKKNKKTKQQNNNTTHYYRRSSLKDGFAFGCTGDYWSIGLSWSRMTSIGLTARLESIAHCTLDVGRPPPPDTESCRELCLGGGCERVSFSRHACWMSWFQRTVAVFYCLGGALRKWPMLHWTEKPSSFVIMTASKVWTKWDFDKQAPVIQIAERQSGWTHR